jgi:hypothetical protein
LDAAFHNLERALEQRDPWLVHVRIAPQWDPLRRDPRFARCLAKRRWDWSRLFLVAGRTPACAEAGALTLCTDASTRKRYRC